MTLTQLKYIVAVDKYRHFATAAEKSYVTQPTLSMQIHKLEEELGVTLFDRTKTPVIPTEIGVEIIEQAKEILRNARQLTDTIQFHNDELKGTFRVGVIPTVAPYLVPRFLRPFIQDHPKLEPVFEELLTQDLIKKLQNDELDAGIIATDEAKANLFTEDLYVEPFVAYLSTNHPLVEKEVLTVDDLDRSNIWLLNEGHCFRDQAVTICKESGSRQKTAIEFKSGNLETLKKLVEQNFGMTLLPYTAVMEFDDTCSNGIIKQFKAPVPSRKVRLAYSRKHLKKNIISTFKAYICDSVPPELKTDDERLVLD
ncbi:MAG: hydrogen peroxide-inducible genes activator [Balneolaceae bacterium]